MEQQLRKVTVMLPADLVERAMKGTGEGLTPTIRRGLEMVTQRSAYQQFLALRGKVKFTMTQEDIKAGRADRS